MNFLQISTYAGKGSGGVLGALRLYQGIKQAGHSSRMLAGTVNEPNEDFAEIKHNFLYEKLLSRVTLPLGLHYIHFLSSFNIPKHSFYKEADLINFHSIHSSYFNYLALPALTKNKICVWTLHDMWALTGHCLTNYECDRWKTGCGKCPYPQDYPAIQRDNTALEWKLKNWAYSNSKLKIITPSKWLAGRVKESMLKHFDVYHIPNGVDTNTFRPINKTEARQQLNVPLDKSVLLFSSYDLSSKIKGGDLIINIINRLPTELKQQTVLILMGENGKYITEQVDIQTVDLGFTADDARKALIFSAADVLLYPTRADNLPYVVSESLACGTPVVSFDVGGVCEQVLVDKTGVLAKPLDEEDFLSKVIYLLQNQELLHSMPEKCVQRVQEDYALPTQVNRYLDMYQSLLK